VRGVCINLSDPNTLRQLIASGAQDRDLGLCQTAGVNDGEWLTVEVCVAGDAVTLPARACEMGDGVRLTLSDRDWERLASFARRCTCASDAKERPSGVPHPSRGKILVVSAEPAIRNVVAATLSCAGFTAAVTTSAEEAMCTLQRQVFDLLILDTQLPDAPSTALMRRLADLPAARRPGTLMLASGPSKADATEVLQAGADDFVVAPFRRQEFVARVLSLLQLIARGRQLSGAA
jgi:CheY-like chemotaxis protein